ncbi:hypothetical protein [Sporosarcina jiandibaonis]|uniref:hypothetical protein n=1 Tax=Sporosarcina jiandibaonis TaxID=2715535 RepID=UPI0015561838|nr:hypothetical protein [Sporosarcina jiandibaonis]
MAFGLVAGTGVAFGASDAGQNLQTWYNGLFKQSTQEGITELTTYANGKIPGLVNEYNGLKNTATNSINTSGETGTAVATSRINEQKDEHITAINKQKTAIAEHMATQFNELSSYAEGLINEAGAAGLQYATTDLTTHTGAKGEAAVKALKNDLEIVKGEAVSQLQSAINNAKSELQAQLATEKDSTVEEIKGKIDAKIIELRGLITTKKNELVAAQQTLIKNKAAELENAAKEEMQGLVDGI